MAEESQDLVGLGRDPDPFKALYREHAEAVQRFLARIEDRIDTEAHTRNLGTAMDRLSGGEPAVLGERHGRA